MQRKLQQMSFRVLKQEKLLSFGSVAFLSSGVEQETFLITSEPGLRDKNHSICAGP